MCVCVCECVCVCVCVCVRERERERARERRREREREKERENGCARVCAYFEGDSICAHGICDVCMCSYVDTVYACMHVCVCVCVCACVCVCVCVWSSHAAILRAPQSSTSIALVHMFIYT